MELTRKPVPRREHVLELGTDPKERTSTTGYGWPHRITDSYRLRALRSVFAQLSGSVIDYGCGTKPYEAPLRHAKITGWVGIDYASRTSGDAHANRADFFLNDGRIPLASDLFDIALSTQVFEHVEDLGAVLSELKRVLRPGATLVATCPMTSPLHEEPFDFRRFTPYGLQTEARQYGFELIRSVALGGPISTISTLIALYLHPVHRLPVVGRWAHHALVEAVTRGGALIEAMAFRRGFTQSSICFDFLFVLKSLK